MRLEIVETAGAELCEAAAWYGSISEDLGHALIEDFLEAVEQVQANPRLFRERAAGHRRVNLRRFPYFLAFIIRGEAVVVTNLLHQHRRPL